MLDGCIYFLTINLTSGLFHSKGHVYGGNPTIDWYESLMAQTWRTNDIPLQQKLCHNFWIHQIYMIYQSSKLATRKDGP